MRKIISEELKAEALIPDPFTGLHWVTYRQAVRDNEEHDVIVRAWRGALAVAKNGTWTDEDGKVHDINEDAPMAVLLWLSREVNEMAEAAFEVPKASSGGQ